MTETEYLASADPAAMWHALERGMRAHHYEQFVECGSRDGKPSRRKMRLWACACCRLVWDRLGDHGRAAVVVAENYAAGLADDIERLGAVWAAHDAYANRWGDVFDAHNGPPRIASWAAIEDDRLGESMDAFLGTDAGQTVVMASAQADLFREVMGNPFRPAHFVDLELADTLSVTLARARLRHRPGRRYDGARCLTPTVQALAEATYADRDWTRLPILADALEEAGLGGLPCPHCKGKGTVARREFGWNGSEWYDATCPECGGTGVCAEPLLVHLRGPGPHALGCWALDAVLRAWRGPNWP